MEINLNNPAALPWVCVAENVSPLYDTVTDIAKYLDDKPEILDQLKANAIKQLELSKQKK